MGEQGPPGVIVTDPFMPGIDGWRSYLPLRSPEYAGSVCVIPLIGRKMLGTISVVSKQVDHFKPAC
jgi:hypothetical protein